MDRFQRDRDYLEATPMRPTRIARSAAALALSVGTAACGFLSSPAANAQPAGPAAAAAVNQPAAAPPLIGVNLYVNKNYTFAQTVDYGVRNLAYIANTLKLKAVSIDWDYNVPNRFASVVYGSAKRTPTIADVRALTDIAKGFGLQVEYRVLFAINNQDARSGSIQPKNFPEWLDWLYKAEKPALKLAQDEQVGEFVAGTEMASIDQSPLWGGFFAKAAKLYTGKLSYASWGGYPALGGFFSASRVLLPLTYFGASAYPPFPLGANATVAQLTAAWERFLGHAPAAVLQATAIDEMGIPAVRGAYQAPWVWDGLNGPAAPMIQARWFQAACQAVTALHLRGLYFWSLVLSQNPASTGSSLVAFAGRPASEDAVRSCAST
jgi:hypothetical protein